jgi:hypothetical protein
MNTSVPLVSPGEGNGVNGRGMSHQRTERLTPGEEAHLGTITTETMIPCIRSREWIACHADESNRDTMFTSDCLRHPKRCTRSACRIEARAISSASTDFHHAHRTPLSSRDERREEEERVCISARRSRYKEY